MISLEAIRKRSRLEIDNCNKSHDLAGKTARGGVISLASNLVKVFTQLFITAILSRILSVNDYGLMAMSWALIAFLAMFQDMGMATATLRERVIDHRFVSTLFWVGLGVSLIIYLICCALSPLASLFYRDDRLTAIVIFSALTIPLAALGGQQETLLTRQGRFLEIQTIRTGSQALGGLVAIVAAWLLNAGYWALAIQGVSALVIANIGFWSRSGWIPGRPSSLRSVRGAFSFGGYLMLFNAVNYAHRQMDNVIVGRVLGAASLGLYSRAYNIFMLPLTAITWPLGGVVIPLMARSQDDFDKLDRIYRSALASIFVLTAPVAGAFFLFAEEAVTILYGSKWLPSADVLRVLAIAILWQPAYTSGGWIEIALGRTKRHFHASVVAAGVYLICYLIGVRHGIFGIAVAYCVGNGLVILPWLWWCTRGTNTTLRGIWSSMSMPSLALLSATAITIATAPHIRLDWWPSLLCRGAIYGCSYLIFILLCARLNKGWFSLIEGSISKLFSNRKAA